MDQGFSLMWPASGFFETQPLLQLPLLKNSNIQFLQHLRPLDIHMHCRNIVTNLKPSLPLLPAPWLHLCREHNLMEVTHVLDLPNRRKKTIKELGLANMLLLPNSYIRVKTLPRFSRLCERGLSLSLSLSCLTHRLCLHNRFTQT